HWLQVRSGKEGDSVRETIDHPCRDHNKLRKGPVSVHAQEGGLLTICRHSLHTQLTFLAGQRRVNGDTVAGLQASDLCTNLSDNPGELVPQQQGVRRYDTAICHIHVCATETCKHHANEDLVLPLHPRLWHGFDCHGIAVLHEGFHRTLHLCSSYLK